MSEEMVQISIPKKVLEKMQKELDNLADWYDIPKDKRYTAVQYIEQVVLVDQVLLEVCNPYDT